MFLLFWTVLVGSAFPYRLPNLSLWITKHFPMDYQAFAYRLPSLPLWITKHFPIDPSKSVQNLKNLNNLGNLVNMYDFHSFSIKVFRKPCKYV